MWKTSSASSTAPSPPFAQCSASTACEAPAASAFSLMRLISAHESVGKELIATTTGTGSTELVYSDNYEEFVPGNQPRHVVNARPGSDSDELIYRAEYEAYVPKSLNTIVIGS